MTKISFDPDERVLAELSPSRRSLLFPVLEMLLITGLIWLCIGLIDDHFIKVSTLAFGYHMSPPSAVVNFLDNPELVPLLWTRRGLLVLWVWLAWRRCIKDMIYRHRARIIVTDRRVIVASGHLRSRIDTIPMHQIVDARARGSKLDIYIVGARMPYHLVDVPHAKRITTMIHQRTRLY
ncbi:hypothetical protein GC425_03680 [Corynebacterium sp. zg254]|uniref:DUF304 domain-containing protein n=1 Tax=Corynebacterium zhongnanshanii TaxID=2768834 RepID=A0ABQ6VIJ9_9CORY|nr:MULTISPECIES: hypothetical protein [Corynebacterium]KAB3522951.1 hypothetical protein F8377_01940 [Corynebacterium zhongnanshanii]MCR5913970.1 hypothetical protein [Corynebacterium sp. zg254]